VLEIRLLGAPEVRRRDRGGEPASLRPAEVELLAFVALGRGRPVPRDLITAALWHEGDDLVCRRRLNTALWRLRAGIEGDLPRGTYLRSDRSSVLIDLDAVEVDVTTFEQATEPIAVASSADLDLAGVEALQHAVDAYHGDLLEGRYNEWIVRAREHLLSRYLGALSRLLRWHLDHGDAEAAVATGLRLLERDPMREDVHRALIRCFVQLGSRSQAMEQYHRCRTMLSDELGLEPMPETTAALAGWEGVVAAPAPDPQPVSAVLAQLRSLRDQVEGMAEAIDASIEQLRR
jgi:DNA-binding SARP family transcriptional activator